LTPRPDVVLSSGSPRDGVLTHDDPDHATSSRAPARPRELRQQLRGSRAGLPLNALDIIIASRECSLTGTQRHVLTHIALYAGGTVGVCFASATRLADDTGLDEKTVRRAIAALLGEGVLKVKPRPGRTPDLVVTGFLPPPTTPGTVSGSPDIGPTPDSVSRTPGIVSTTPDSVSRTPGTMPDDQTRVDTEKTGVEQEALFAPPPPGPVVQRTERRPPKPKAAGSTPAGATRKPPKTPRDGIDKAWAEQVFNRWKAAYPGSYAWDYFAEKTYAVRIAGAVGVELNGPFPDGALDRIETAFRKFLDEVKAGRAFPPQPTLRAFVHDLPARFQAGPRARGSYVEEPAPAPVWTEEHERMAAEMDSTWRRT
jgi:hypothetical protein